MSEIDSIDSLLPARSESKDRTGILTFGQFLRGSKFVIPGNQRPYVWKTENINEFLADLHASITHERFFGPTLLVGSSPYKVVDGQQRMTTATLLALVIIDICEERIAAAEGSLDETTRALSELRRSSRELIFYSGNKTRIKYADGHFVLALLEQPDAERRQAIAQEQLHSKGHESGASNVARAYLTIREHFDLAGNGSHQLDLLHEAARALRDSALLIAIHIDNQSSGTQLFESLNGKGVRLTKADEVKNILVGLATKEMIDWSAMQRFEETWSEIVNAVEGLQDALTRGCPSLTDFLHYFMLLNSENFLRQGEMRTQLSGLLGLTGGQDGAMDAKKAMSFVKEFSRVMSWLHASISKPALAPYVRRFSEQLNHKYAFLWAMSAALHRLQENEACSLMDLGEVLAFREMIVCRSISRGEYPREIHRRVRQFNTLIEEDADSAVGKLAEDLDEDATPDRAFRKCLVEHDFKDSRQAFYVLRWLEEELYSFVEPAGQGWELEHVVPISNVRPKVWRFSKNESETFSRESLWKIGNMLILSEDCNKHVSNRGLGAKIEGSTCRKDCSHIEHCKEARCTLHYLHQPYRLTRGFKRDYRAEIDAILRIPVGKSRFSPSTRLVKRRTLRLADSIVESRLWSYV